MDTLIGLGIGVLVGAAAVGALMASRRARLAARLIEAEARADSAQEQLARGDQALAQAADRLRDSESRREASEIEAARLGEQLKAGERRIQEQQELLARARSEMTDSFRALGAEALQANNRQFLELARTAFERLMAQAKGDVAQRQQAIDAMVRP
ncbi:MAG: hypothetical protein ACYTJ0_06115, partial [Planctomycetota bacterium]